jgi:YD repeat-containing protein
VDTTPALTLVVGEVTGPQRTAFIHDARGNHTAATELLHTATGTAERALTYTYDALSRLVEADASFGTDYAYGYDVAGNLVDMNGVARTYNAAIVGACIPGPIAASATGGLTLDQGECGPVISALGIPIELIRRFVRDTLQVVQ